MLRVDVDDQALRDLGRRLGATEAQIIRARDRAIDTLQRQVEAQTRRAAARALRMPVRNIGHRIFRGEKGRRGSDELRVWIGAREIMPARIGTPRTYGRPGKQGGVRVARYDYPGAFLARVYQGSRPDTVWIRLRSRHYSQELYPTIRRSGDRGYTQAGLRGRFPVVRAAVRIDDVLARVVEEERALLLPAFKETFARELRATMLNEAG